ncbi:uncharacterized protein MELLADRAFT_114012 [Melampsora larici-populina 98AG31]|uniref:Secreted protein n=1 Tax=Melampsora larici-populina (strain 98AG31 / pathotype 3-4-7) TaxID=747676 RepID=F4SBU8_MELLP|nr:uncharacterized protein MELLADRAFT_114012 [Melampsora larici-populina 98AG31]EGF97879.1 hypothetical protein MELLADRAFT_114012 [Melampsora larici-populina 98AG31]
MRSSSTTLLPFLFLIFVSSILSLYSEKEVEEAFVANRLHSHAPDADLPPTRESYSRKSSGRYSLRSSGRDLFPTAETSSQTAFVANRLHSHAPDADLKPTIEKAADPSPASANGKNWNIYYEIAPKVLDLNNHIPVIKALAQAVIRLGTSFPSKKYTHQGLEENIVPYIDFAHSALKLESLGLRERIWMVGVLSCLKYQPLGEILVKMWSDFHTDSDLSDQDNVVWEALQRASLSDSILHQMRTSTRAPSIGSEGIRESFLRLKTPIDDERASKFTDDVVVHLAKILSSPRKAGALDEGKVMVQFLLHMQENHLQSRLKVLKLIRKHQIGKGVHDVDIRLQLAENPLGSPSYGLYSLLKNIRNLDIEELNPALKAMLDQELSIHQWGKLLRILEVSNTINTEIYSRMDALLSDSEEITMKFGRIVQKLYPARANLSFFSPPGILTLISKRAQDLKEAILRKELEERLVSEGMLSAQIMEPPSEVLMWNFKGDRIPELRLYLETIFHQIMSREVNELKSSDTIIEYILRLISLKNDDQKLIGMLSNQFAFKILSSRAVKMIKSARKKLARQTFESYLQKFEEDLLEDFEKVLVLQVVHQGTDAPRFVHE